MKYVFPIVAAAALALIAYFLNWDLILSLDFGVVWRYKGALWRGLELTFVITLVAGGLGLLCGILLAILSQSRLALLRWVVAGYVELFRNTPLLVQLFWIHFALPQLTGVGTTAFQSGLIAMTLQSSAYFCEIVRAGIEAIPRGYWDAAHALALPGRTTWTRVILPPAMRIIIPPLANLAISFFKATAILSILLVSEFMTVTTRVSNYAFKPIELFTFAALVYYILGTLMSRATMRLEVYLRKSDR